MKIINVENVKEKLYLQKKDILYLNTYNYVLPSFLAIKMQEGIAFVTKYNESDFVSFDEPKIIDYFRLE